MLELSAIIVTILVMVLHWKRYVEYWEQAVEDWQQKCAREKEKVEILQVKVERMKNAKPKFSNGKAWKVVGTVNGRMLMDTADLEAEYERLYEHVVMSDKIIARLHQVEMELREKLTKQQLQIVTLQMAYEKLLQEKSRPKPENGHGFQMGMDLKFDQFEEFGDQIPSRDARLDCDDEMDEAMRALG